MPWSTIFFWFYVLSLIVIALRVLSREYLAPVKRLAWLMVLFILPIAGMVLYFLFGEARLNRFSDTKHTELSEKLHALEIRSGGDDKALRSHVDKAYRGAFRYAQSINGFGVTLGNKAELLPDGEAARTRLIDDLDAAKSQIHVLYYIWLKDETGTKTVEALIRAAKRGVECKVMADALGSRKLIRSKLWKEMKEAGVEVSSALPYINIIKTVLLSRFDLRNHRKITVIDGKITYCGSQNCADEAFLPKKRYAPWVDIMLRFEGPIVAQNSLLFASDWLIHNDETEIDIFDHDVKGLEGGFPAQVWGSGPTDRVGATSQLFTTLIGTAQKELTISTPYFVPEETVLGALYSAAHRGIKVRMIFPARNDSFIVRAASQSYYRELLDAGVDIYEFEGGLLHSKTITIDGKISMVGSTNIDLRSFDLNYENNILFQNTILTKAVRDRQETYINASRKVSLEQVRKWSLPKRIWNNMIAALGPVL